MNFESIAIGLLFVVCSFLEPVVAGKVVCYYGSWASYRKGNGTYLVENIDPSLCTHIIYSFAGLNKTTNTIQSLDPPNDLLDKPGRDGFKKFANLVTQNPNLIPMLAIGGWNEGSEKYSTMASKSENRKAFINSIVELLEEFKFKGFDLDWEYPTQREGNPSDKANFVTLLKELKVAFKGKYVLSLAVGVAESVVNAAYDVEQIVKYADFINLMLYDMHSYTDGQTGHNAPYNEIKTAIEMWIDKGAPASKLILGVGSYGKSFTLADPKKNTPNSKTTGPGNAGPYTKQAGFLGYNEICESKWTVVREPTWQAPYAYRDNQWVGYDDVTSVKAKCALSRQLRLGGGMIWSMETDDFLGNCGDGKNPITKALKNC